jgi:hypothetical protein
MNNKLKPYILSEKQIKNHKINFHKDFYLDAIE